MGLNNTIEERKKTIGYCITKVIKMLEVNNVLVKM
jgi:hypothetical protein